jgi:hypothetical protein
VKNVYGDDAVDYSTISRWACRLSGQSRNTNIQNFPSTGRLQKHLTVCSVLRHVTVKVMSAQLGTGKCVQNVETVGVEKSLCKVGSGGC